MDFGTKAFIGATCALVFGALVWIVVENRRLQSDVASLTRTLEAVAPVVAAPITPEGTGFDHAAGRSDTAEMRETLASVVALVEAIDERQRRMETQIASAGEGFRTVRDGEQSEGEAEQEEGAMVMRRDGAVPVAFREAVVEAVETAFRTREEAAKERAQAAKEAADAKKKWEPTIEEFGKEMELSLPEQEVVKSKVVASQKALTDLLLRPRTDGVDMAALLLESFSVGQPQKFLVKAAMLTVPGETQTYVEKLTDMKDTLRGDLAFYVGEEKLRQAEQRNLDIFAIKAGFDIFKEIVDRRKQ